MPMAVPLTLIEGVEGEVVVGKDEASEGYEEIGGRAGGGRAFRKELLKSREAMSMEDFGVQGINISGDKQNIG